MDGKRAIRRERRSSLSSKKARKERKEQLGEQSQLYEEAAGLLLSPGIADWPVSP